MKYADTADGAALENDWRAMTDVHQFFGLLRKYQLSRQQAFRLVSDDLACRVARHALPSLLETVRQEGNEIMISSAIAAACRSLPAPWKSWPPCAAG